jgi:ribonuclease H / adenosylcobalamin/alpha-ribazole phosphatase
MTRVDGIVSSPLQRAKTTADHIAHEIQQQVSTDNRLAEFDFGDLEGLSFVDLQTHYPDLYLSLIDQGGFARRFPNGESRQCLHERVSASLDDLLTEARDGRIVVVAHLMVIAAGIVQLTSGDPDDLIRYLVHNCSVSTVEIDQRGNASIALLNDVSHLDGLVETQ